MKHIKTITVVALFTMIPFAAFAAQAAAANLEVKTEGECVPAQQYGCNKMVFSQKQGPHTQAIFCGDTSVYGDDDTKKFIKAHVSEGHSMILTNKGQYKDGYCSE